MSSTVCVCVCISVTRRPRFPGTVPVSGVLSLGEIQEVVVVPDFENQSIIYFNYENLRNRNVPSS